MNENNEQVADNNLPIEKSHVPDNVIKKIFSILDIKQPKESFVHVQCTVEKIMDKFFDKLKAISNKQKISDEDIKDLMMRDEIEYLKDIIDNRR